MRRNRKTDNFDKRGYRKSASNVLIYKQRNGKGYNKYKLIPILLDKYYIVNFSDLLYPYIVKRGYESRGEASKNLKKYYDPNKREFFNIVKGKKLAKIKPVLEGSIKFRLGKGGVSGNKIEVGLADRLSIEMTKFLDINPKVGKLMNLMYRKFHRDYDLIYTTPRLNRRRKNFLSLGVLWPYHVKIALALEDSLRELYPQLSTHLNYLYVTVALMLNEPRVLRKVSKPLNKKESEAVEKYKRKLGITKYQNIYEAMARGFHNYKNESGSYKRNIDLENNNYLILPLSLLTDQPNDNRDPILIYPRSFQFSFDDNFSNYIGYEKTSAKDDKSYLSLWDAWKLLDCYCLPRIANKYKADNISKEIKRAKRKKS